MIDPAAPPGDPTDALPRTESLHPATANRTASGELARAEHWLDLFDREEARVSEALASARPQILSLGHAMARTLGPGTRGRVISVGAGTSGRLGALDAAEWGPTFGVDPARVRAVIAGGLAALTAAIEGAEDDRAAGTEAIVDLDVRSDDLVIGISASGSAAFVEGALSEAGTRAATLARITAAVPRPLFSTVLDSRPIDVVLTLGPELLAGSTRLQAATATHRVLQRASVLCAVELGWIHRGRMVEMRPTNQKLKERAIQIVADLAAVSEEDAARALAVAQNDIKVAIVSSALSIDREEATRRLESVGRRLAAIEGLA